MADDVLANAVHRQPAPNININDKEESLRLADSNNINKMDEDDINNKDLLHSSSYRNTSTGKDVEKTYAVTNITNNNTLNECPPTPFTSNTTNNKASLKSYLEKTPTNTSSDDMVIDTKPPPLPTPDRSPTIKRYFHRKPTPSQQQELPSPNVPPIRPFTLGQTIDMTSLSNAAKEAQTEITGGRSSTETSEQIDTKSALSMDTSDVSKVLKPKSIFNPYAKQHRNKPQDLEPTGNTQNRMDVDKVDISAQISTGNTTETTQLLMYDRAPLIPTHTNTSINSNESEAKDPSYTHNAYQEPHLAELSQEEVE
jgi:hypothetical protein